MVDCWSNSSVKEEVPLLHDGLEPLNEQFNEPDQVQLQNPKDFNNIELVTHFSTAMADCWSSSSVKEEPDQVRLQNPKDFNNIELVTHFSTAMVDCWSSSSVKEEVPLLHGGLEPMNDQIELVTHLCKSEDESEQKCQPLRSFIDVTMEKVSLLQVLGQGYGVEEGLKENELKTDGGLMETKSLLEPLENDGTIHDNICDRESNKEEMSIFVNAEFDGRASLSNDSCSDESGSDEFGSEESSSIHTSSSGSEDEDDCAIQKEQIKGLEEGELSDIATEEVEFMSDEEEEAPRGPIRSKHEVEDLPPVPKIEVELQPHHQILPVGVISSIVNNKVIVEGSIRHNPLDEGSILWVTHSRLPLGLVDEIFGPVKKPYYVVRYTSEEEVPSGIEVGISISFVLEFASPILNDKELYKKGYDASGDNDEEVNDEIEFSDDEKEAKYKRSLHAAKRAIDDIKGCRKKESRFEKKRTAFQGTRNQNKGIRTQPTQAPSYLNVQQGQSGSSRGFRNSTSDSTNATLLASRPASEYPQTSQPASFFSNPSQQMLMQHAEASLPPGFLSMPANTGLQVDLPVQLQSQNLPLSNFVNALALQQLISNPGNALPWLGPPPPLQPMGQNAFAPNPFVNVGFMNAPGLPGLSNEQFQSQVPQPFVPFQFNAGHFNGLSFDAGLSSSRGRRPCQRGGGRAFGQGSRWPNR
ncbi:hypothetical protein HPP92_014062 [Vanilla planifolia]|uniref:H/ACA ribonucleoprotein complex non-core subunit NAF1 n=1 Tax=Vanilla planifolia TaxID=51239 RepID=A0A835UZ75_VANPL|nr:hypothetical protein HPP92_014062 [Vanilla planifolia]